MDVSVYAPTSGNQDMTDDFVRALQVLEEMVIQWAIQNAETVFSDFDPVPDETCIRERFRSSVVDRIESVKFRLPPEIGCAFFDVNGTVLDRDAVRAMFQATTQNLPNIRIGAEVKSVGIYNPTKRRGAKVPFEGKIELRLFAIQARLIDGDSNDGTTLTTDVCMIPAEDS